MHETAKAVGAQVRRWRKERGLSQKALAEKTGLNPSYIGQVERGEKNVTIESLYKVSVGLDVALRDFFEQP